LHTATLLSEIEAAVAAAGGWGAVERIAVGIGPGTFTGLRIGVATARALGFARGLPVTGVCTLDALGRALGEAAGGRQRLAVLDARRGEVFAARHSAADERIWGPLVCAPQELAKRLEAEPETALCGGSGALRFRQQLTIRGIEIPDDADPVHRIAARHVCALAAAVPSEDESASVAPIYLRPPDAERWRERDSLQKAG
jgi:tRNA threonylcarbamoyladenosine biosynthesis protein TsaB